MTVSISDPSPVYRAIVVDDNREMRNSTAELLDAFGWNVQTLHSASRIDDCLAEFPAEVILTDQCMPGTTGLQMLKHLQATPLSPPVVLITAYGDIQIAVEAMRHGAYEFIEKPYDAEKLVTVLERAADLYRTKQGAERLKERLSTLAGFDRVFIGQGPSARTLRETVLSLRDVTAPVMIRGETGTGKSLIARALHDLGPNSDQPFLELDCAVSDPAKVAEMLNGVEGGSVGLFERIGRGTIFLSEIATCSVDIQARLLRVFDGMEYLPVGALYPKPFLGRFISSTNVNLEEALADGTLRNDLFYRLSVITLDLPSLRGRPEDILLLFTNFLNQFAATYDEIAPTLGTDEIALLMSHTWYGNVRELRHSAERWLLQRRISKNSSLAEAIGTGTQCEQVPPTLREATAVFEAELISRAIISHGGQMDNVAEYLGIPRRTLNDKILKLNINKDTMLM